MNMFKTIKNEMYSKNDYLPYYQNSLRTSGNPLDVKVESTNCYQNYNSIIPPQQQYGSKTTFQSQQIQQSTFQPQNIKTCCTQKTASYKSLEHQQQSESIYQLNDYLCNFGNTPEAKEFLKRYQVDYQDIKKIRSLKEVKYQINFQHLKQLHLFANRQDDGLKIKDFIQNYQFQQQDYGNCFIYQEKKHEKIFQANKSSQLVGAAKNNDFISSNLQDWVKKTLNLPKVPQKELSLQISKQFFLFMSSSYKILKKFENSNDKPLNKQSISKKLKNYSKEEEHQLIQQLLESTASNFVEEFILYKDITEAWRIKWKNSMNNKFDQTNKESVRQTDLKITKTEEEFVQQSGDSQQSNAICEQYQQIQQNNSQTHSHKSNTKCSKNLQTNDFQKKKSNDDTQKQEYNNQETSSQNEYLQKEDEFEANFTNSGGNSSKKRTNNFYNMPRYFMMLMLEFLSDKNLKYLNIQDGLRQVITRIKHNITKQGKKKDSAKSNFYNHTHYNCLFKIVSNRSIFQGLQSDCDPSQLSQDKNANKNKQMQQKSNNFDKQMDELIKRVFEINNTKTQYNIAFINIFKVIISQVIKYQLQIMQDLPLAQYILQNGESYEKSKVNYIARVISGIDKLNDGYDIYRF